MQQHIDNAIYDVRVDGVALPNWRVYQVPIKQEADGNYWVWWYVPYGPLTTGTHTIAYQVTWRQQISDGYDIFGPGTGRLSESGSCTLVVQ